MLEVGSAKACAGVPLVMLVFVAKLKGRRAERAFDAAVLPYAYMHAAGSEFVNGLPRFFCRILGYSFSPCSGLSDVRNDSGNLRDGEGGVCGRLQGEVECWRKGKGKLPVSGVSFDGWLTEVRSALDSINMPMDDWQRGWRFDFQHEFGAGTAANDAAVKANRFWWHEQNKAMNQECRRGSNCWLPRNHKGECQPLL